MKSKIALALIIAMFVFPPNVVAQTNGYSSVVATGYTAIWDVEIATNFTLWYTEGGYCAMENDSEMAFSIQSIADDVYGTFYIGNVTVAANDTMVAQDLALGIWPSWLTGLFVEVGQENIDSLNETAFAAAERVSGNWMNGTMSSHYANITVGQVEYECLVFDYEQDPPGTQVTHLAYALATGVLVEADTSVTFGSTYRLVISLVEIAYPTPVDFTVDTGGLIVVAGIMGGGLLAVIALVYIRQSRQ